MPGPNSPYTKLDANQVLQQSFDEANDRLRVDASVTAVIPGPFDVNIQSSSDNIAIRNTSNSNELLINADGSINTKIEGEVSIEISAADGDNIAISNGTTALAINTDGSINITDNNGSLTVDSNNLDIRNISQTRDSIKIGDGTDLLNVNTDGSLSTNIRDANGISFSRYNPLSVQANFNDQFKDPFGRLITSSTIQLEGLDHRLSKNSDNFDELIVGSATSTWNSNTVSVDMTTTTSATDSVIRQTFRQFEYVHGNGQLYLFSLNPGGAGKANNNRLWGAGDSENGVFFGVDDLGLKVLLRSKVSGVVIDTAIYQNSFNGDKVNGSGASGFNIDLSKENLFYVQYSWLGSNIIEFGIIYGKNLITLHTFYSSNNLSVPWCQSGSLPVRFENTNIAITSSSTTLSPICCAIYTLGSAREVRSYRSVSSGVTAVAINTTEKVITGIRPRPDKKYIGLQPDFYHALPVSGTNNAYYKLIFRPTLVGATWSNLSDATQVLTNNPTYTGGIILSEGFFSLAAANRIIQEINPNITSILGYSINNTPDSLILVVRTDTGTGSIYFSNTIKEII